MRWSAACCAAARGATTSSLLAQQTAVSFHLAAWHKRNGLRFAAAVAPDGRGGDPHHRRGERIEPFAERELREHEPSRLAECAERARADADADDQRALEVRMLRTVALRDRPGDAGGCALCFRRRSSDPHTLRR